MKINKRAKFLSFLLAFTLVVSMMPMVTFTAFAADSINVSTEAELIEAINSATGTVDYPTEIIFTETIEISSPLNISNKNIIFRGSRNGISLKAGETFTLGSAVINLVEDGNANVVIENLTVDANSVGGVYPAFYSKRAQRAIAVRKSTTLLLSEGAVVTGGSAWGGGFYVADGTLIIDGGVVTGNIDFTSGEASYGGGILLTGDNGLVELRNGSISKNICIHGGGGIYADKGIFKMSGGSVDGNISTTYAGGGIRLLNTSKGYISGGSIRNNKAKGGGAIYFGKTESLFLSGKVEIVDNLNIESHAKDNVRGRGGFVLLESVAGSELCSEIGSDHNPVAVGGNSYIITEDDLNAITYTKEGYLIYLDRTNNQILAAESKKITFHANNSTGASSEQYVPKDVYTKLNAKKFTDEHSNFLGWNTVSTANSPQYVDQDGIKVSDNIDLYAIWDATNTAYQPTTAFDVQQYTYDGTVKTFKLNDADATNGLTVSYYQGNAEVSSPTEAGVYDVKLHKDVDGDQIAYNATIYGGLVINKALVTIKADDKTGYVCNRKNMPAYTLKVDKEDSNEVGYTGELGASCTADGTKAGKFSIIPDEVTPDDNHAIKYVNGTLTLKEHLWVNAVDEKYKCDSEDDTVLTYYKSCAICEAENENETFTIEGSSTEKSSGILGKIISGLLKIEGMKWAANLFSKLFNPFRFMDIFNPFNRIWIR